MRRPALAPLLIMAAAGWTSPASAQQPVAAAQPAFPSGSAPPGDEEEAIVAPADQVETERSFGLFPIGARQAIERGYDLPPALGASGMYIHNVQNMDSRNLAVTVARGADPPEDANLIDVPFVTTRKLESHTSNSEFKADLWVLPFLNVFAGVGKVRGHIDIDVDIDLDAVVPPPICRPANPCGHVDLPFRGTVDNTTVTVGAIAAYGGHDWFAALAVAKTLSVSEKDRSNIETTNIGLRAGPRLHFSPEVILFPYAGVNYFDLDATVSGVVRSGPVLPGDDTVNLRYRIDLSSSRPWSVINGFNLALSRRLSLQAEYDWGEGSDRFVLTATYRP